MKKNNKGFTLIELLATIVILGLLATLTITSLTGYYKKSKEKANEAFKEQLVDYVNDYIALYGGTLEFDTSGQTNAKCYIDPSNNTSTCEPITVYKAVYNEITNVNLNIDFISDYFANKDIKNPSTEEKCTKGNLTITIYRDTDRVYCQRISSGDYGSSCIDEEINTCKEIFENEVE